MSTELVLLCVAMALYIGFKVGEAWYLLTFKTLLKELNISEDQLRKFARDKGIDIGDPEPQQDENSDLPILEVRVEQHPEGLFAYRKADDSFIAQGKDREGLMAALVNNLTNVRVIVHKEDGADLINP
jgi:hypothetical protein